MSISFLGSQKAESGVIASSRPVLLTSVASHAKSTYQQHIASTASPAAWIMVGVFRDSAQEDYLIDIGIGAGGSEVVLIPTLPVSSNLAASANEAVWLFPLFIPAGSRITSRCQMAAAGGLLDVQVTLFAPMFGGELGLGQVEACGAITATSRGTSVDPGGTLNTKGAWVQLIAATTVPYKWACLSVNHTNVLASTTNWVVDIGIGAGGSEVVVVPDLAVHCGNTGDTNPAVGMCFPLSIPAGTRVAVRCSSAITTANERLLEVVLHGCG